MGHEVVKLGDDRGMVAGFAFAGGGAAFIAVDAYFGAWFDEKWSGEDEVNAQTPAPVKGACPVIPPRVDPGLVSVDSE